MKRSVVVMSSEYSKLYSDYYMAQRANNQDLMNDRRTKLLSLLKDQIKPGVKCAVGGGAGKCNFGSYPGADKLMGNVTWLAEKDFLQVKADVTDRFFAPAGADGKPEEGSSTQIFVCPSGSATDINVITIVPEGTGGKARVSVTCGEYGPMSAEKDDCAKRAKSVAASWSRTNKGYTLDVKIPWSVVRGYYECWKLMPVDAAINSKTPEGRSQLIMNKPGDPATEPFVYAVLRGK